MASRASAIALVAALALGLTATTPVEPSGCYWNCNSTFWGEYCESEYPQDGQSGSQCTNTISCIWCIDEPPDECCVDVCDMVWCYIV